MTVKVLVATFLLLFFAAGCDRFDSFHFSNNEPFPIVWYYGATGEIRTVAWGPDTSDTVLIHDRSSTQRLVARKFIEDPKGPIYWGHSGQLTMGIAGEVLLCLEIPIKDLRSFKGSIVVGGPLDSRLLPLRCD